MPAVLPLVFLLLSRARSLSLSLLVVQPCSANQHFPAGERQSIFGSGVASSSKVLAPASETQGAYAKGGYDLTEARLSGD